MSRLSSPVRPTKVLSFRPRILSALPPPAVYGNPDLRPLLHPSVVRGCFTMFDPLVPSMMTVIRGDSIVSPDLPTAGASVGAGVGAEVGACGDG
jgi:hypothetical protein